MDSDLAIKVSNISKRYTIGAQKDGSLRGTLAGLVKGKSGKNTQDFWALKDVSFEIKRGDVLGIIGKNGAGKSTLLKILSQITKPTSGKIEINGRIASLLEVGTGFHPELTGRENIYLNGTILGMTRKEVKEKFDEIVEFSGVQKFIDTPVKHYSSGMYVRLAFAVAAHLDPEILIIDEVLAVGDAEFQKKCMGKMKDVAGQGRTVIFVSHNLIAVKELCTKVLLINQGVIQFSGLTNDGIEKYRDQSNRNELQNNLKKGVQLGNEKINLLDFSVSGLQNEVSVSIDTGVKMSVVFHNNIASINLATSIFLLNEDDMIISEIACIVSNNQDSNKGKYQLNVTIPPHTLNSGFYHCHIIFAENQRHLILEIQNIISFEILSQAIGITYTKLPGVLALSGHTTIKYLN